MCWTLSHVNMAVLSVIILNSCVSIWDNSLVLLAVSLISGPWRWSVCTWTSSVWSKSSLLCWTWWKCHSLGFGKRGQNPVLLQHGNYCALCRYAKATFLNFLLLVLSNVGHPEACICNIGRGPASSEVKRNSYSV